MGAKQNHDKDLASSGLSALKVPLGTVLTDAVTIGRSGREWHLYLDARRAVRNRDCPSGIEIKRLVSDEEVVVRKTCEFLRQHAPGIHNEIYSQLRDFRPVDPVDLQPDDGTVKIRLARMGVEPIHQQVSPLESAPKDVKDKCRRAPFKFHMPEIGEDHWAIPVHHNPGNYMSKRSGGRKETSDFELKSDMKSIKMYLNEYKQLSEEVSGRNVWSATREANFRAPYYTCMEICVGEAHLPSHFLALVHYGIGLQFMYEHSFEWEKRKNPKSVSPDLIDALKDGFRTLARLYREDFGV